MAPLLPVEVVERAIDFLHDDSRSLSSCASVCRSWLPRCYFHRFAHITLPISSLGNHSRCAAFGQLVEHDPDLLWYIQALTLSGLGFLGQAVRWTCAEASVVARMATIRSLSLARFELRSLVDLVPVICALPVLEDLSLDAIRIVPSTAPLPAAPSVAKQLRAPRALRALHFTGEPIGEFYLEDDSAVFASALFDAGALIPGSLASLTLLSGARACWGWLPFFPRVGASLQHCSISLYDPVGCPDAMGSAREDTLRVYDALLSCTALQSLRVQYNATSTLLRSVFVGATATMPSISPLFLQLLAELLARPDDTPFPSLQHLSFIFVSPAGCLSSCADEFSACARALGDTSRYPCFSRVSVRADEPTYLMGLFRQESPDSTGAMVMKGMFDEFEKAGKEVGLTFAKV